MDQDLFKVLIFPPLLKGSDDLISSWIWVKNEWCSAWTCKIDRFEN